MSIEVKSEDLKSTSPRSLLKNKLLGKGEGLRKGHITTAHNSSNQHNKNKSAKELVREIIEKRKRVEAIAHKREQVKSMKRKLRQETKSEQRSKQRCLTDLRSKPDLKKYRKFEEERELHNHMERQRRVELKDAYDSLKERIPSIATEDKVSKLMILNTASDYCKSIEERVVRLRREQQQEMERGRRLRERLNMLRLQVM